MEEEDAGVARLLAWREGRDVVIVMAAAGALVGIGVEDLDGIWTWTPWEGMVDFLRESVSEVSGLFRFLRASSSS